MGARGPIPNDMTSPSTAPSINTATSRGSTPGAVRRALARVALVAAVALVVPTVVVPAPPAAAAPERCRAIIHRAFFTGFDEEQPAGIKASARWGWGAELDLRVTKDGKVVLVHDDTLKRITGGADKRAAETLTYAEVTAVPLKKGGRVLGLWKALRVARNAKAKLLLEVKRYPQHQEAWDDAGLAYIARAIRQTRMNDRVFVGGSGKTAFQALAPDLQTFHRTVRRDPADAASLAAMATLIQLDSTRYDAQLVADLRGLGARVASRNTQTVSAVKAARAVGLRTMQTNKGYVVKKGCAPAR
jgi:glycerophosphoryl diester phosphodiesterase